MPKSAMFDERLARAMVMALRASADVLEDEMGMGIGAPPAPTVKQKALASDAVDSGAGPIGEGRRGRCSCAAQ